MCGVSARIDSFALVNSTPLSIVVLRQQDPSALGMSGLDTHSIHGRSSGHRLDRAHEDMSIQSFAIRMDLGGRLVRVPPDLDGDMGYQLLWRLNTLHVRRVVQKLERSSNIVYNRVDLLDFNVHAKSSMQCTP